MRAGAVVPHGPVKQYVDEVVDEPLTLVIYSGADGSSTWYEDDGRSFAYRTGAWMKVTMTWRDTARRLTLELAPGARMLPPAQRQLVVRVAGETATTTVTFEGRRLEIDLPA